MHKIKKYYDYLINKIIIKFYEKVFEDDNGVKLKYIFKEEKKSNILLVVFSSCTRKGVKARYNYIRTLKQFRVNQLFILDDYGYDSRGVYYLGKEKKFTIEQSVRKLIHKKIEECNSQKTIYIGSSKGGYGALYFGLGDDKGIIVSGAPQYILGDYLKVKDNEHILEFIMGDKSDESINYLNRILHDKVIHSAKTKQKIYIHCSTEEHTYRNHVGYLINDIRENTEHHLELDLKKYQLHSEIGKHFPGYLIDIINKEIDEV